MGFQQMYPPRPQDSATTVKTSNRNFASPASCGICWSHEVEILPQCTKRIHPYYDSLTDDFSGRHTQPNCKESEERRGKLPKQTIHQETKAKLSSVTPNRDKTIHCKRRKKHPGSNVAPQPRHAAKACDNNTQTIPNNMVLSQRLATCRRPSISNHIEERMGLEGGP